MRGQPRFRAPTSTLVPPCLPPDSRSHRMTEMLVQCGRWHQRAAAQPEDRRPQNATSAGTRASPLLPGRPIMQIDLPDVVAEVRAAFARYENALVTNDVTTLDEM